MERRRPCTALWTLGLGCSRPPSTGKPSALSRIMHRELEPLQVATQGKQTYSSALGQA